jgi:PPK2 family polyphosphate:nucleotide phosphotransferase
MLGPDDRLRDLLRVPPGPVDLRGYATTKTPGLEGEKPAGLEATANLGPSLADLQERLYAEAAMGGTRSVLLVLQGMDTSGKGGVVKAVLGAVDPKGIKVASFKAPTKEELAHHFLWRVRPRLPEAGLIGAFDRSHYEDVLIVRVHDLVEPEVWQARYDEINEFEADVAARGTRILKVFLHISSQVQRKRLLARLDDPTKYWKFNSGDIDERLHWDAYLTAYEAAIERCNTEVAPWYLVPADHKWYRNWAVAQLLLEELGEMGLEWPAAAFDVEEQRRRLQETP